MSTNKSNIKSVVILVTIGTICWIVAATVAVALSAESKIIWTCLFGAALGVTGISYAIRRSRRSGI